ncbi:MAG: DUF5681 domain-containing protein [Sinimarinibacterium flocculans]|uniref:DUF5681 domain-containing protein n=1 Tax=Sinimarinibacterium flocculans TaxID=985250 RepID=UPI003C69378A
MAIKIIKAGDKGAPTLAPPDASEQYKVGYRKPPKHSQFRKGESGNPRGRRKGVKNFDTILAEELGQTITVTERGKQRAVTKGRAVVKTLIAKALSGDQRATANLLKLFPNADRANRERDQVQDIDQVDREILAAFQEQLVERLSKSTSQEK